MHEKEKEEMRLHDCNNEGKQAYRSLDEAIAAYEEWYGEEAFAKDNGCCNCSLGIGVDEDGNKWFIVAQPHYFTNCYKQDLKRWTDWYEDEWIEREDE